ncbi:uncharacterized protein N7483_006226 [Penicillium malachiteum]|uniref:uncharacterized protein n=1 Tax=Penicillium malachiteum TaxID=1324776 RepID=UPI00254728B5|nr:uncharacterized protein N7483_006226 [Penicillium malachiteum]KAJ5731718.1 hypothetical protein N7483_006226 [Penicillium malachiteum]
MSLKQEIETWVAALDAYDNHEFEQALRLFSEIADTSKILFNCGVIYATLGEHDRAVDCYQRAVGLDRYLAIAYFQQGVSNFLLGDFEEALANFNDTLLYLRGNTSIDYEQLGLKFRLFSCEVLFNRGLCYVYLQQMDPGMKDLQFAAKEKVTEDHDVIDDAIRENADGYTVFSIPVGTIYRPNAAKVKNLKAKDYLGKSRLVAQSDRNHGIEHNWRPIVIDKTAFEDRDGMSYAATNLVHKNLSSRTRQQSEPPINRAAFPPTPPPDDRSANTGAGSSSQTHHRTTSLRSSRPPRLDLERPGASVERRPSVPEVVASQPLVPAPLAPISTENPRIGTTRTASEPRGPSSRQQNLRVFTQDANQGTRPQAEGHRRNLSETEFSPVKSPVNGDLHSNSRSLHNSGYGRGSRYQPPQLINEEEEEHDSQFLNGEKRQNGAEGGDSSSQNRRTRSPARYSRNANSRRPEVLKFRTKVHAPDDIRYIMIGPSIEFGEFEIKIREKFGFHNPLKIRVQDDGDMITMVDQEDLDLLLSSARDIARREGSEMGKMEVWVEERKP